MNRNAFNQIKKIIEHSGATSEITYDGNGNTLAIKDARNQTTSYTYDNMDRVISRTDSLQGATSTETFEYDVAGNAVKLIDDARVEVASQERRPRADVEQSVTAVTPGARSVSKRVFRDRSSEA